MEIERHTPAADLTFPDLLADVAAAQANAERLADASLDLESQELSPEDRRTALNAMRAEMDAAHDLLRSTSAALQAAFVRQMAQTTAALKPLQEKAAQVLSAVEAISLYLGSDEQIVELRAGEPAAADTPITVYQSTLFMDEEMALAAEAAGIADATIDPGEKGWATFDEWLLASDDHVRQVCPAPRGVVAFRSAREQRKTGIQYLGGDGSEVTHFLIVNGEQLTWVVASDDFSVGNRLVPLPDEFEKMFYDRYSRDSFGNPVKLRFGSAAWDQAQRDADATQKHYLKIALILQGIVDRSTLLSPLPSLDISFTSVASYDAGHIVIALDAGGNALPSGVLPFKEWQKRIMADLEPGQRVVLGNIAHKTLYGEDRYDHGVLHPRTAGHPPTGVALPVKRRKGGQLAVSFKRTDQVWKRNQPVPDRPGYVYRTPTLVPAEGYASVELEHSSSWALPIDHELVTVEALEWYLLSRENRRHFRTLVPLLRSALKVLRAERDAEAPFIELLVAEATRRFALEEPAAREMVAAATSWWKTKKREHRALVAGGDADTAAYHEIVAELERRVALNDLDDDPAVLERIAGTCPDAMFVGRRHDGTYVALTPCNDDDVYVHVNTWTAARGVAKPAVEWVTAPDTRAWKTIQATKRHAKWPRFVDTAGEPTGPELAQLIELLRAEFPTAFAVCWYTYWSPWRGEDLRRSLKVHLPGTAPAIDVEHPLTGISKPATTRTALSDWHRTTDGVALKVCDWGDTTSEVRSATLAPLEKVLWCDDASRAAFVVPFAAEWEAHVARVSPLASARSALFERLSNAWRQRALEAEYASFVEKFGAESLGRWETRRKAFEAKLRFPHSGDALSTLLDHAAELGLAAATGQTIEGLRNAVAATGGVDVTLPEATLTDLEGLEF